MHDAPRPTDDLDSRDAELIRQEVATFLRHRSLRWSDKNDLFQECAIRWIAAREKFTAARGASRLTYLRRVVHNVLMDILKWELAEARRAHRKAASLDQVVDEDEDDGTLLDLIAGPTADPEATAELGVSLKRAWARLSPRQRRVVNGLAAGYRKPELAREIGVHRDTLYAELRRIRRVFRDEGLDPRS